MPAPKRPPCPPTTGYSLPQELDKDPNEKFEVGAKVRRVPMDLPTMSGGTKKSHVPAGHSGVGKVVGFYGGKDHPPTVIVNWGNGGRDLRSVHTHKELEPVKESLNSTGYAVDRLIEGDSIEDIMNEIFSPSNKPKKLGSQPSHLKGTGDKNSGPIQPNTDTSRMFSITPPQSNIGK
jgi:hypothetical protein